jgi:alpha-tubulin suppressor-like RCC1 family protein
VRIQASWSNDEKPIQVAAGLTFSLVLTDTGRGMHSRQLSDLSPALISVQVYSMGSGEHGQLGHGKTGEHIVSAGKIGFDVRETPGQ